MISTSSASFEKIMFLYSGALVSFRYLNIGGLNSTTPATYVRESGVDACKIKIVINNFRDMANNASKESSGKRMTKLQY